MQLRNYQAQDVEKIRQGFGQHRRQLYCLPTGGGKSAVMGHIIQAAITKGRSVHVVVHRDELIRQIEATIRRFLPDVYLGKVKAGEPVEPLAPVQLISIQSWKSRADQMPSPDLIITDEAHRAVVQSYLDYYACHPQAFSLGLTATPIRQDGLGLSEVYDNLICGPSTSWLIQHGYLAPYEYKRFENLVPKPGSVRAGEFSLGKVARDLRPKDYAPMLIEAYRQYVTQGGTFVFCMDITHAEALAQEYNDAGISSAAVTAETPADQRQNAFTQFLMGEIRCLMSVDLFSEGIDLGTIAQMQGIQNPQELLAIQMARPTASLRIFLQQIGRVLRYAPGKTARILDHVDNFVRHGLPDDKRRWTLQGEQSLLNRKTKQKYAKLPPTERSWRQLGFTPGRTQKLLALDDSVYWSRWLEDHIACCNERGYRPQWVMYRLTDAIKDPPWEMFEAVAQWLTKVSDAKRGWAYHQYRKRYGKEPPVKPKSKKPYWKGMVNNGRN